MSKVDTFLEDQVMSDNDDGDTMYNLLWKLEDLFDADGDLYSASYPDGWEHQYNECVAKDYSAIADDVRCVKKSSAINFNFSVYLQLKSVIINVFDLFKKYAIFKSYSLSSSLIFFSCLQTNVANINSYLSFLNLTLKC